MQDNLGRKAEVATGAGRGKGGAGRLALARGAAR